MSNHELLSWSGSLFAIGLLSSWGLLRLWYFSRIRHLQNQVQHSNGQPLPGRDPRFLVGNLTEVYGSANRLSVYLSFHENFGKIVQIFWLWKQQISVASYYQKYPPNALLRRLFGSSVLTSHGEPCRRYRVLWFSERPLGEFLSGYLSYVLYSGLIHPFFWFAVLPEHQPFLPMVAILPLMSFFWMWLYWRYRDLLSIIAMHIVIDWITVGHLHFPWFEPFQLA
ncbi:MAG: hypothetical protein SNJ68_08445 [Cyanobacteriota bacterium]